MDVAASVLAADVRIDDCRPLASWPVADPKPESFQRPADSLRAAGLLFKVVMTSLILHIREDHDLLPCFMTALLALNESINTRIREEAAAYTGYLLERVHGAQIDERRRIARELHDRLGEGISLGLRQLDMDELAGSGDSLHSSALAREALIETMGQLRLVTSDLRHDRVTSLEKALIRYLDSVASATVPHVRLRVSGDEVWVPPDVIDEVFMIIREAIRNALTHGAPKLVMIDVDLSPRQLRASVEDDGQGFFIAESMESGFAGTGLVSMRERAAMIRGQLSISSAPGHGARIELIVPLP
jgi:signal transduction histidine kinase